MAILPSIGSTSVSPSAKGDSIRCCWSAPKPPAHTTYEIHEKHRLPAARHLPHRHRNHEPDQHFIGTTPCDFGPLGRHLCSHGKVARLQPNAVQASGSFETNHPAADDCPLESPDE